MAFHSVAFHGSFEAFFAYADHQAEGSFALAHIVGAERQVDDSEGVFCEGLPFGEEDAYGFIAA